MRENELAAVELPQVNAVLVVLAADLPLLGHELLEPGLVAEIEKLDRVGDGEVLVGDLGAARHVVADRVREVLQEEIHLAERWVPCVLQHLRVVAHAEVALEFSDELDVLLIDRFPR